jgi:hypothetical protein
MSIGRRLSMGLALFAGFALVSTRAHASVEIFNNGVLQVGVTSVTMDLLQAGWSIQVDDKLFDHWKLYGSTITGTGLGTAVAANSITVTGLDANPLNPGVEYQSAAWQITNGQLQDTKFQYNVSVVGGAKLIEDGSMTLLSGDVGSATSAINITEHLTDGLGHLVAPLSNFEIQLPGSFTTKVFDQKFFSLVNFVQVNKDIALSMSADASGITSFSDMAQNYSQTAIPEPSSMAIAGLGALGLIGYGLRRRKGA